jgi:DNA-directed RNA polymerase specialized sigma24 family protein
LDERAAPHEPDPPPDRAILDPRDARARHRRRTRTSAGLSYLRVLTAQERHWLDRMVARTARAYGVEADDLLQDLQLSLLECDTIDRGRREVRGWLKRRAHWRAADLLRRDGLHRRHVRSLDEMTAPEPVAPKPTGPDADWSLDRLEGLRLNRDEAQVVLLILWGLDISLREFAELVERSHAKARQDKSRGLRKIEELFDLEPEERAAFIAFREYGTVTAAAVRLGISNDRLRCLVRQAEHKINRALGNTATPARKKDESDAR